MVVGEASGDFLGASLIKALKKKNKQLIFTGVGGPLMEAEGFQSLYPMSDLTYMGLFEGNLSQILRIYRIFKALVTYVNVERPDLILTIDFPGFNLKLGRTLKTNGIPHIHYVAPTVWAWKKYRARQIATFLDHLLVLFPFEPPYFTPHQLPTTFVGHPLLEMDMEKGSGGAWRKKHRVPASALVVTVLPGSRMSELSQHLTIFRDTMEKLKQKYPTLWVVMPTLPSLVDYLKENWMSSVPTVFVTDLEEKVHAYQASKVALAASGTVTLELALARLPMVMAYKVSALTAFIVRCWVKIPYFCLVNIVLGRKLVPELLQEKCSPDVLYAELVRLIENPEARAAQKRGFTQVASFLRYKNRVPSDYAAQVVLEYLGKNG